MSRLNPEDSLEGVAVVGLSCRLPRSRDVGELWRNLRDGAELITFFSRGELAAWGVDPAALDDPAFVGARGIVEDFDALDAAFFELGPGEAEALDPQHRLFLECAWEALESAGYDPGQVAGDVAVFAGAGANSYLRDNLLGHPGYQDGAAVLRAMLGNDRDFLATRVSYKLGLRGPSIGVQTACSTSLVAIHLACQALLNYQCDLALAGGVSVRSPHQRGHVYQEGGVFSPDGHCRAFDAAARGTVGGDGAGVVALKRLEDALADGDLIYAVVRSSAVNNDGAAKLGYTAPSVEGQAEVIATAHALAGVDAGSITYVEAHGTGTPLGDPIELAALTRAFRATTRERGFCALGSIKTNTGHLDAAAGVAGFLKTVLALHHRMIPPSLHFTAPNPQIDLAASPFRVNTELAPWPAGETPRRAGVSSFGIGGTNAHAVLEEAPEREPSGPSRSWHLMALSARTPSALDAAARRLVEHLAAHPGESTADVAFTLRVGRKAFEHRRIAVCRNQAEAVEALAGRAPRRVLDGRAGTRERPLAFLFPGQGAQHPGMARGIYEEEPVFRQQVDLGCERLAPLLGLDLRHVIFPEQEDGTAGDRLERTDLAQPALFVVEHALARLWMEWGVRPQAMLGHSLGEYVAACLAGVFSFDDALELVAARGRLMQELAPGAMLACELPAEEVEPLLAGRGLSLAAVNSPSRCTVSGPAAAVEALASDLAGRGIRARRLRTARAFHSSLVEPALAPFARELGKVRLRAPEIPFLSNVTGTWITAGEATDPGYWVRHLRQPVRFSEGAAELLRDPDLALLEVGPGTTLGTLVRNHPLCPRDRTVVSSLRHPLDAEPDLAALLTGAGRLWLSGARLDNAAFYAGEHRRRVALPTYPFERRRFWVEPPAHGAAPPASSRAGLAEWFEVPAWRQRLRPETASETSASPFSCWVFLDDCGLGRELAARLEATGGEVVLLAEALAWEALVEELRPSQGRPVRIVHLGSVTREPVDGEPLERTLERSFFSLVFLVQALAGRGLAEDLEIVVVSNGVHGVTGEEPLSPAKATLLGPCTVIPQELPGVRCRHLDVVLPASGADVARTRLADRLSEEILAGSPEPSLALRGDRWWHRVFEPVRLEGHAGARLRERGTWLITGGLGGLGLALAERLAREVRARLVLVGRRGAPDAEAARRVAALESLGAEVMVAAADVTDRTRMAEVVAEARRRFGAIHGVIHAAGVPGGGVLEGRSREALAAVLGPKVAGTQVLASLLAVEDLDAFVLCSSLGALLGGVGQVDYCAANAFLDAFAASRAAAGARVVAIDWDTWREAGMAVAARGQGLPGLSSEEGREAFLRALAYGAPQIAVSLQDLSGLIRRSREPVSPADASGAGPRSAHPRPDLESGYAAPRNATEAELAAIWAEVLGLAQVGIHDEFSALGGDSLIATQVCSRVRKQLAVDLPLQALFTSPTVAELAVTVVRSQVEKAGGADLAGLLARLEDLSDEEVEQLLGQREGAQ